MTQKQIEITLIDTYGKSKTFALKVGRNGLVTKPIHTERGFGDSHTDVAVIDGFTVSGDVWRFFEGTLDDESLHQALTAEGRDSSEFLEKFVERFNKSADDEIALIAWDALVSAEAESEDDAVAETMDAPRG